MARLDGRVALVTGGSRGVGRGIAAALADAGATVYVTGRSFAADVVAESPASPLALRCDHTDDEQTSAVFARVLDRESRLDVLVNACWGGYERMVEDGEFTWPRPFWQQPLWRFDAMFAAGLRPAFVCSRLAAPPMLEAGRGLIVNLSYWAAQKYLGNALYGVAKCATDRLTRDLAHDLAGSGVAVVSLYPGLVRTEAVLAAAGGLDLSNSESPRFVGRAIAHLAADPKLAERSGAVLIAAELARDYGFSDDDGTLPAPLTLETA